MDAPQLLHEIDAAARKTGLSTHVIRVWEKRYRAVEPVRSTTNRRQYSEAEIERLGLLRDLTRAGQSIGYVAKLPTDQLRALAASALTAARSTPTVTAGDADKPSPAALVEECLEATRALDRPALTSALQRAAVALGLQGMLQRVAAPLAQALGERWRDGSLTAAHEHFASAVLRLHLAQAAAGFATSPRSPGLIVATPEGQLHELGALLAAALATNLGWRVVYLGASLPAAEIAGAALQHRARAVALSLVYPTDDPTLATELARLRTLLPPAVSLIAGGRATEAYHDALEQVGAQCVGELDELGRVLDRLRATGAQPAADQT